MKIDSKTIPIYISICLYIIIINLFNINPNILNNVITPLFWIVLFIITFILNKDRFQRIKYKTLKNQNLFIVVTIYLIIYFLTGLIFGYSKNIYNTSLIGIIKNIWPYLIPIVFMEYVRCYSINSKKDNLNYFIIVILFVLASTNIRYIVNLKDFEEVFKYLSSSVLPLIANSLVLIYISKNCGFYGNLFYAIPPILVKLVLPILPNYDWFFTSLYGLFLPIVVYIFNKHVSDKLDKVESRKSIRKKASLKLIILLIPMVLLIVFVAGVFKYKPIGIVSNSMAPIVKRGDVVVTEKINKKNINTLKKYDIIVYILDNIQVAHRIISIEKNTDGKKLYTTMGDNNNAPDLKKVKEEQILGRVKFSIPKIGYPSVYLKELFNKKKANVETGK